jgi:ankyrin repeat domain-containing protein 13
MQAGDSALMIEVDHEKRDVYTEQMRMISPEDLQFMQPTDEAISTRLTTPVVTTYIDTEKISFERNKSGIWGWRADKVEEVNGHECKVFAANNVELVTKTRIEHLSASDRAKAHMPKSPLQSFLGIAETEERAHSPTKDAPVVSQKYL